MHALSNQARARARQAILAFLACTVLPGTSAWAEEGPLHETVAFVGVNVVPMDSDRVLSDQTVLVSDGRIAGIGHRLAIPPGAHIVPGQGRFLSPGLADMHTHSQTSQDLKVYLANGVTSVLNMGDASPGFIDTTRPAANAGRIPGPHVYAAFKVDGSPEYNELFVDTPDEARAIVHIAKTNGYDFIKVYNNLSAACFQALLDEARHEKMAVVGHGVTAVGLEQQLGAGQAMVAHAEEFLYTVFLKPGDPGDAVPDPAKIPGVVAFVLRDRAFVTADLNTYATIARQWGRNGADEELLRLPEARYLRPEDRLLWTRAGYTTRRGSINARLQFLKRFIKAMSDAGVPLIAGTDAPSIPGLVPGFSLHDDLRALVEAGLSPYQALVTATRAPGEFIHRFVPAAEPFGTVTVGARADLILSEANPLDDLATLRQPVGVMAAGHWYPSTALREALDSVTALYKRVLAPAY